MKRKIEVTPEFFAQMFRKGFKAELIGNEVLDDMKLKSYGFNPKSDNFYFIFASDDAVEGEIVEDSLMPIFRMLE